MRFVVFLLFFVWACTGGQKWAPGVDFEYVPIKTDTFEIATWQKIKSPKNPRVHIYIEGDGSAFDAYGRPTDNPTPRGDFVRNLAESDTFDNVVYVARPCQYIMDNICNEQDWTSGRFSKKIIDAESQVITLIAGKKKITLIGYSGGAMVSGLVIKKNKNLNVENWITIAGVLNHKMWTEYFGDEPLYGSLNMDTLPNVHQKHFVGEHDEIVPYDLAKQWANPADIEIVSDARHNNFKNLNLFDTDM